MAKLSARERIRRTVEKWFVTEPLFLAVWTMHALIVNPRIGSIRVGQGRIEYNPDFIDTLDVHQLAEVLEVEAMRIVLKHPYLRRKARSDVAYQASNLTLQEYLETSLPIPRARDFFGAEAGEGYAKQYFEFYYVKLLEEADQMPSGSGGNSPGLGEDSDSEEDSDSKEDSASNEDSASEEDTDHQDDTDPSGPSSLDDHASVSAADENTRNWGADDLFESAVNEKILTARETNTWGSKAGRFREQILASLSPKLDYRAVLRQFRTSVLSVHRRLTRMKPNRRYGFQFMGSCYDFSTKLLVAVDVSGSMSSEDLTRGFSVVNRFFKYGVPTIDVVQFDTEIKGDVVSMKRAQQKIRVEGRGGTNFTPVIEYIDENTDYDGLIIFTDGYAEVPPKPRNRRTRVMWLFTHEKTYENMHKALRGVGRSAFLRPGG